MTDNSKTTTGDDSATILADFRRRLAEERGVSNRLHVVLPGKEPGTLRVLTCEDAEEAAGHLCRYWRECKGRTP